MIIYVTVRILGAVYFPGMPAYVLCHARSDSWLVGWLDAVGGLFFLPYVSSHSLGRVHFECFSNPGGPSLPTSNTRSCCFCCCSVPILQSSFPLKQFNLAGSLHLERMNEQCVQLVECKQTVRLASCLAVRFFFCSTAPCNLLLSGLLRAWGLGCEKWPQEN